MLLKDDKYHGHIYTWVSPTNPYRCLMIGIRNRVDNIFQSSEDIIRGIAPILLEGVRRFAVIKGCNQITVAHPLRPMIPILEYHGFEPDEILLSEIGASPASEDDHLDSDDRCSRCRTYFDILLPISSFQVNLFSLIE